MLPIEFTFSVAKRVFYLKYDHLLRQSYRPLERTVKVLSEPQRERLILDSAATIKKPLLKRLFPSALINMHKLIHLEDI